MTAATKTEVRATVHERIRDILAERDEPVPPIADSDKLSEGLGLRSMDLALLVAELEVELGVDPFQKLVSITGIRTVDDLVAAYALALTPDAAPEPASEDLAAAARRAERRRARKRP